jgi:hypothetical protein
MFLGEQQVDEVFIPEVLLNSISSLSFIDEEKQSMLQRNANAIRNATMQPVFCLDSIPSSVNNFQPLMLRKGKN